MTNFLIFINCYVVESPNADRAVTIGQLHRGIHPLLVASNKLALIYKQNDVEEITFMLHDYLAGLLRKYSVDI